MAAITMAMGFAIIVALKAAKAPFTVLIAPASFGIHVIMVPTAEIVLPIRISTGPSAATSRAMIMITRFTPSGMAFRTFTIPCSPATILRTAGISRSPKEIASSCSWDFRIVICPSRLSCIVSAMFFAASLQLLTAPDTLLISSGAAFIRARKPDMAFFPTSASALFAFSASVIPPKATRQSARIADRLRMDPSALVVAMVTSPIAAPDSFTSPVRLVMMERREVPAWEALIPAFPIRPMASAVSSTENPKAPATGAQYLNVSPIMETLVFALALAAASTSAKCPESSAFSPNAVSESVTISEVVARSSPDAAARFMTPSMPPSISPVFQPAMAM